MIDSCAKLAKDVTVEERAVIQERVTIDEGTRIGAGCVVGPDVTIGRDCRIYPNVTIYPPTFGLAPRRRSRRNSVRQRRLRLCGRTSRPDATKNSRSWPARGIEDDVEIGANSTVDRGALDVTRIRRGTKIDNLVHVGHNVDIGEDVVIAAQTGVLGSSVIENGVIIQAARSASPITCASSQEPYWVLKAVSPARR